MSHTVVLQSDHGPPLDLAAVEAAISTEWLTKALSGAVPGAVVTARRIDRVLVGCSVKVFLSLACNDTALRAGLPTKVVLKSGFGRHGEFMEFTYLAEMLSYRDVLAHLRIRAPHCHYAGPSPTGGSVALILEDLSARGVRFCHAQTPLSVDEATAFVRALAEFHSQSWNITKQPLLLADWRKRAVRVTESYAGYFAALMKPENWAACMTLPRGAAIPMSYHDRERILAGLTKLERLNNALPHCVAMGDEHPGNLYIERDGTPGFLDFQARVCPWIEGLCYFIIAALDVVDRREAERYLIQQYLATLAQCDIAAPDFDAAWLAYRRSILQTVVVWATNSPVFQTEAVNTAYATRASMAAIDHDVFGLLEV